MLFGARPGFVFFILGALVCASASAQTVQYSESAPAPRLPQISTEKIDTLIDRGFEWVLNKDPSRYTLQILAAVSETQALDFVEAHNVQADVFIYPAESQSRLWFKLVYGVFTSEAQALEARDQLPGALRSMSPWVRQFAGVQNEMAYPTETKASRPVAEPTTSSRPSSVDFVNFPLSPSTAARTAASETAQVPPGSGICVVSGDRIIQESNNACEGLVPRQ